MAIKDVYIPKKEQKESALDKVLKGVQLAQGIVGTIGGVQSLMDKATQSRLAQEALAEEKRRYLTGEISGKDVAELAKSGEIRKAKEGEVAPFSVAGIGPVVYQPRAGSDAITPLQAEQLKLEREKISAAKQEKELAKQEKASALEVPGYGFAKTADDAKKIKDGLDNKRNMEAALDRLIEIRKEYGSEILNRDIVNEAKRLATDIKLTAKNQAQLGVLSKSDEMLLARIIPDDPTQWKTFEKLTGQDSILSGLEKYKAEQENKFENMLKSRLATRVTEGSVNMSGPKVGDIEDGYRFKGGDKADPKNWEKVK